MGAPGNSIFDFFESTQGMTYQKIILFAEQEATRAERLCLSGKAGQESDLKECRRYAECLKQLIFFFRYGYRPAHLPEDHYELFRELCRTVSRKRRGSTRCDTPPETVF
jgi:hypothetical protein